MLPSTGYFKAISCPFYDSGLCERPFCHFRHVKKEIQNPTNELENGAIFQQLVTEAVKKVLQQTDPSSASPTVEIGEEPLQNGDVSASNVSAVKVSYNPTPIAELQKIASEDDNKPCIDSVEAPRRHIPVPYTPHKPKTVPTKRTCDENGTVKPFIYNPPEVKYTPGSNESKLDPYLPKGGTDAKDKYLPGSDAEHQAYAPPESKSTNNLSYVPSGSKGKNKKNILEYTPAKVKSSKDGSVASSKLKYKPTPLAQVPCFSSDEDEPVTKKSKVEPDLNGLDDLDNEFEIIGQILDEEKPLVDQSNKNSDKENSKKERGDNNKVDKDKNKKTSDKDSNKKTSDKYKSSRDKDKRDIDKTKSSSKSDHKNSGTSETNDKNKTKDALKDETEKKKHSSSKSSKDNHKSSKSSESSKSSHKSLSKSSHKSSSKDKSSSNSSKSSRHSNSKHSDSKHSKSSDNKESSKDKSDKHTKEKVKERKSRTDEKSTKKETFNNDLLDDDNQADTIMDELVDELSESDEEQIALECMKIFEEYVPTVKEDSVEQPTKEKSDEEYYIPTIKRISHSTDKNLKVLPKPVLKPDHKKNAAQAMSERLAKVKEFHAANNRLPEPVPPTIFSKPDIIATSTPSNPHNNNSGSKVRIAHVPNVSTMLTAKRTIPPKPTSKPSTSTPIETVQKGGARVAHIPNDKFVDRPGVLEPLGSRIPANLRSTYLNMMIDVCLKIYLTPTDAYARAQQEELNSSKKCMTISIYKNSAVLAVSRLRKEFQECGGVKKTADYDGKISHDKVLIGKTTSSWSIENKNKKSTDFTDELRGAKFYKNISQWVLTEEQLQENGFPRPHPSGEKGRAKIYVQSHRKQTPPQGFIRTCCRCKNNYTVNKKGFPVSKEECIYHPNNKYRFRGEVRYQCCSQDGTSDGCCIAPSHVYEYVDYENLRGFVKTMPKEGTETGVYALDCEMCYTTQGLDLTRITVINSSCKTVYETFIKPLHPIIDYNTRYSGITEEQMEGVSTTILEVQASLLAMFSDNTILIGHSLESDFKALKLIHNTVIDTSVVYPHKMGPPFKRALRNLSSEYLKKIIQNSVEGHDSAEDATVCMELIQYKLKEDLKLR